MLKQLEEDINYWMDGVELDLYATFFFFFFFFRIMLSWAALLCLRSVLRACRLFLFIFEQLRDMIPQMMAGLLAF